MSRRKSQSQPVDLGDALASVRQDRWITIMASAPPDVRRSVPDALASSGVFEELKRLSLTGSTRAKLTEEITEIVVAGAWGRTWYEDLIRRRRKFAFRSNEGGTEEIDDGVPVHRQLRAQLHQLGRQGARARTSAERMRLDQEIQRAQRELRSQKRLDHHTRHVLLGQGTKPERIYLKLVARALTDCILHETGRPRHGLVAMLLLEGSVFADPKSYTVCRPWDRMTAEKNRCRRYPRTPCPKGRCRRAEDLVKHLVG